MISKFKNHIKTNPAAKRLCLALMRIFAPFGALKNLSPLKGYLRFFSDWRKFKQLGGTAVLLDFYPCLTDRTATTGIDTHYFHQAIWAMKRITASAVAQHVDVGSDVRFVGMLTVVTNVTFIDIRPLTIPLNGYTGLSGSIVQMPFADQSLPSLSSLHVIEHVGLGRYGDPLDPYGSVKACAELSRVLAPGGTLYVSVPIGKPRVQFNSQRIFDPGEFLTYFKELELKEFSCVTEHGELLEQLNPTQWQPIENTGADCALGLFVLMRKHPQDSFISPNTAERC